MLFGAGIPLTAFGVYLTVSGLETIHKEEEDFASDVAGDVSGSMVAGMGVFFTSVGAGAVVAGIVCLGVAYSRKNSQSNLAYYRVRERKPLMTYNLQSSRDGLGFAIRF